MAVDTMGEKMAAVTSAVLALSDKIDGLQITLADTRRHARMLTDLVLIIHNRVPRAGCLLTVRKAAAQLGVSAQTLRRWIEDGAPSVKTPGRGAKRVVRVDVFKVLAWISNTWLDRGGKARKVAKRRRRVADVQV